MYIPRVLNTVSAKLLAPKRTAMAPSISPGSAATVLSFLVLAGLQLETRFHVGELLAAAVAPSDEPEPELPLEQLEDRFERLEKTVAGLGVRTARCEALLGPPEETKPAQSGPGARGAATTAGRTITRVKAAGGAAAGLREPPRAPG